MSYCEDSRDDGNNTYSTSLHPLVCVNVVRLFFLKTLINKKCVHSLRFKVFLELSLVMFQFKIAFVKAR
jgi:hypothetical protein